MWVKGGVYFFPTDGNGYREDGMGMEKEMGLEKKKSNEIGILILGKDDTRFFVVLFLIGRSYRL